MTTSPQDHIDKLLASLEKRGQETLERLAALPKVKPCPHCSNDAHIDETSIWDDMGGYRDAVYVCPTCIAKAQRERFLAKLTRLGIPADVHEATLDNFRVDRPGVNTAYNSPQKLLEASKRFLAGEVRNLVLAGTVGIGKGHLGAALAICAIKAGKRVAWAECAKLFAEYHDAYSTRGTEKVLAPLIRADLLVLDEVCLRKLPEDGEEILFNIIDPRHKAGRQTVLLGNKPAAETRAWLGERIRDRLKSGGIAFCFGEWESMRGGECDGAF